ncbi:MAG: SurA N-terminal domain-containing protein [Gammaproteobacteria bacterium]
MLQTIHDKLKGIFAITILAALGVVFVFWGVDVSVGTFTKARGIEVNGREIPVERVLESYQNELSRYEVAFGAAGVPEEMKANLQNNALERAVQSELMRQRTQKLRYEVADERVWESIWQIPAFQVAGKFSRDAYHAALASANLQPDAFFAEQKQFVLTGQLDRAVSSSAFVLPAEFERGVALRVEAREIGWVIVPAAGLLQSVTLDEAAIAAWYQANQDRYMTEERADVAWVELGIDAFASDAVIGEEELREYYEANIERYTTPSRRRARHILVEAGRADGESRAQAAHARARAGEDFAALARELSDDPGSKEAGGDLGLAEKGDFVAAFADAVWAMQPGEIRGPVKSEFGWHVIKLEQVEGGSTRGFDEVRAELARELRAAQVEKAFGDRQEELDTLAFEAAGDIESLAAKMSLPVRRAAGFTHDGGGEIGALPGVVDAVFAQEVLAGRELRTIEVAPGRVIALGVTAHEPAKARPLDEVRALVVEAARLEAAQKLAAARAAAIAQELQGGAAWDQATKAWQASSSPLRLMRRDDPALPPDVKLETFRAPVPQGRPSYGTATLGSGDSAVWRVSAVRPGSAAALAPEERQRQSQDARQRSELADAATYVTAMRANAKVDVNPQLFQ